jgi:WD40 repeat protein
MTPQSTRDSGGVTVGAGSQITIGAGDVVGRDKIVNNIQNIYQRALTAAESAAQARARETQTLASGVSALASRLQTRASEVAEGSKPYKGLIEYRLGDAEIFFGRDHAIRELLKNLASGPLTILHSESGAGKTSLLQAGISPRLIAAGHLPVYLRPYNVNPALSLKRLFISDLNQTPSLAIAPLPEFLRQTSAVLGAGTTLYLLLDQFEEFFTQLDEAERNKFIGELAQCLEDPGLDVRWVLALRTESFGNLANFRPRIRNPFENDYRLNRFTRAEAKAVIAEPAKRRGLTFEAGLIESVLDDLGKNEIAPPQMQLVCSTLYEELQPGETAITRALYEREGGAAGILRGHLERVLSRDLLPLQRAAARRLLESLITSEQQRIVRAHNELVAELSAHGVTPETLNVILNQLVDSRLLKVEETDSGLAYELAHDYLVGEVRLDPEIQARKAAQELLEQELRAYRRFKTLLSEDRLGIIEPYRKELKITAEAEQLLAESQQVIQREKLKEKDLRRRELRGAQKLTSAERQASMASKTLGCLFLFFFVGAGACPLAGFLGQAIAPALAYFNIPIGGFAAEVISYFILVTSAILIWWYWSYKSRNAIPTVARPATISISPEGTYFAVAQVSLARVWSIVGKQMTDLKGHKGQVTSVAFSSDGPRILTVSTDRTARIWDVNGKPIAILEGSPAANKQSNFIPNGSFSPDGTRVITTINGLPQLWDASGNPVAALEGHTEIVSSVSFSPDSRFALTASSDCTARIWTIEGKPVAELKSHTGPVLSASFSADGSRIITASADNIARVWDTSGNVTAILGGHTGPVLSANFSPNGLSIVTVSADKTARLWEATGNAIVELATDKFQILSASFSPDGKRILTTSAGGWQVWDIDGNLLIEGAGNAAAFTPDGTRIVSAGAVSGGFSAYVWDAFTGKQIISTSRNGHELLEA